MMETVTTSLKSAGIAAEYSEADFATQVGIDTFLFYYSLENDLNKIEQTPKQKTIDSILSYSNSLNS